MRDYLKHVQTGRRAKGKFQLIQHLKGKPLTRKEAIWSKCYDCMGFYEDGVSDCEIPDCPLYPFNPYSNHSKKRG